MIYKIKTIEEAIVPFALVGSELDDKTEFSFTFNGPEGIVYARIDQADFKNAFIAFSNIHNQQFVRPEKELPPEKGPDTCWKNFAIFSSIMAVIFFALFVSTSIGV